MGSSISRRNKQKRQQMMTNYLRVCQVTNQYPTESEILTTNATNESSAQNKNFPIKSIQSFLEEQLFCSQYFQIHQQEIQIISKRIHDSKLKGDDENYLIEQLELLIEEKFGDISSKQKLEIKNQIKNFRVESKETETIQCILQVLLKSKMSEKYVEIFQNKYSNIIIDNPFDEQITNKSELFQKLQNQIQQIKWTDVFSNLTDVENKILEEIRFILPLYPYLKQWIYLKKSLNQFLNKAKENLKNQFHLINSLVSQDLIVLLYFVLPESELKLLGDYLTSSCIPLPFVIKAISQINEFILLDYLAFYDSIKTTKKLVTYISTSMVKQEDSNFFCSKILCQDPQNNFNGLQKSLTFDKSIQLVTKIPHNQSQESFFIRINDYQICDNDSSKYNKILNAIICQSQTLIIHSKYTQLMTLNHSEQLGVKEVQNIIQMAQKRRQRQNFIFVTDINLENEERTDLQLKINKLLNHDQFLFIDKNAELKQIWQFINKQNCQNREQLVNQNIFYDLNLLLNPTNQNTSFQPIQNQQRIEKIIEDIEQEQNLLLGLNNLEKEIIDLKLQSLKVRINFDLQVNEREVDQLNLQIAKLENNLCKMSINHNVVKIIDSVISYSNQSEIVDQNKVLQLKMIIESIRGKYIQQYQQKYLDISKQIQEKELIIQQKEQKEGKPQIQQKKEIQILKDELSQIDRRHQQKEITFDMIVNEFSIALEKTNQKPSDYKEILEQLFLYYYLNGLPMQLIEGNTLQFGNAFLKEIASKIQDKDLFVISIIGLQSSAKINFAVGNGRVTKGLYFTRVLFEGKPVIIIDTEGLMSLVGRDQQYDNSVMAFIFLVSNIVIFNQKGEANKQVKELLELCGNIIQQLLVNWKPPVVIFALRDQNDVESKENIEMQSLQLANSISNENTKNSMEIKTENLILFPPAFNEQAYEGVKYKQSNLIFSAQVLKLRKLIFNIMNTKKQMNNYTFKNFYCHSLKVWEQMKGNCSNLIIARNLKEYQDKMDLQFECQEVIRKNIYEIKSQFQIYKNQNNLQKDLNLQEQKQLVQQKLELELERLFEDKTENLYKEILNKCEQLKIEDPNIIEIQKKMTKSELDRQYCIEKQDFLRELQDQYANLVMKQKLNQIEEEAIEILKKNKDKENCIQEVRNQLETNLSQFKKMSEEEFTNTCDALKIKIKTNWKQSFDKFKLERNLQKIKPILYKFYDSFFPLQNDMLSYQQLQSGQCYVPCKGYLYRTLDLKQIENQFIKISTKIASEYKDNLMLSVQNQNQIQEENLIKQLIEKLYSNIERMQKEYEIIVNQDYNNLIVKIMINQVNELYNGIIHEAQKNQLQKIDNQIQNHKQKVEQTLKDIQCILENTDNAFIQGKSFMKDNLIQAITENFIKKISISLNDQVKDLVKNNIEEPTKENKLAFTLCWNGKELNTDNLIKFYLDTPKFIKEMIHKRIENQINLISSDEKKKMNDNLLILKSKLKEKLDNMIPNLENQEGFKSFIQSQLQEFTEDFPGLKLFMQKQFDLIQKRGFISGMIEGFEQNKTFSAKQKFEEIFIAKYNKILNHEVVNAIGCCQTCPHCGAKCILELNHEGTHDVDNKHRYIAYSGTTYQKSKIFCKDDCYSSISDKWIQGDKEYPNMHALNQEQYPTWVEHFKIAEAQKLTLKHCSNFQKMAYYMIGQWFGQYFNSKWEKEQIQRVGIVQIPEKWKEYVECYPKVKPIQVNPKIQIDDFY